MAEFQILRETIHQEYREVVERRVFTGLIYLSFSGYYFHSLKFSMKWC
uniref:Uncharacterized protein MANES_09G139600 n=1 Tax=Rhizophora mucronata TaxID=61149 RepID=A0A2P2KDR4_RHIMU